MVEMMRCKTTDKAGRSAVSTELLLEGDSRQHAIQNRGNSCAQTGEQLRSSNAPEILTSNQSVVISTREDITTKNAECLPHTNQIASELMHTLSKAALTTTISEEVAGLTSTPGIPLKLPNSTTLSLNIARKQKPYLRTSKSSHSTSLVRFPSHVAVPSHSGLPLEETATPIPIPTSPPSNSPSLPRLPQPHHSRRSEIRYLEATVPLLSRDAGMALPRSPQALSSSHIRLNHPSVVSQRRKSATASHSRSYSQDDHSQWRDYTLLSLYVTKLPINVTTLQIWRNFKKHGELFSIIIHENGGQYSSRSAVICYKPPPAKAFWQSHEGVHYHHGDKTSRYVQVRIDRKQNKNHEVQSPIRPDIKYNEEHILVGDRIDFGVLLDPSSLLILKTRKSDATFTVNFHLDLKKKEITVYFPSAVTSEKSGLVVREYRFKVALDQKFVLSQVEDSSERLILLLDIDTPPPYSKKLSEAANGSHSDDARKWMAEDLWARQTDIADTKDALVSIGKIPVSVKNSFVSIDIGRWLTFRLIFPKSNENCTTMTIIQNALRDFNVPIQDKAQLRLRTAPPRKCPILWELLDEQDRIGNDSASLSLQNLMTSRITLSFPVRYQLEVCVSHGYLSEYNADEKFLHELASLTPSKAIQLLKAVDLRGQQFSRPLDIFSDLELRKPVRAMKLPDNCIEIYHATVTATRIYFNTPSIEITNRVVRQYKQHRDRFLRVRFEDDDYRGSTRLYSSVNNKMTNIFTRVRRTLTHGIRMGDRHYKFLAWGNSQLREHGAYFFADLSSGTTAGNIRAKMGEFSNEKVVAKYAARMGQCFSTTRSLACRIPRVHKDICIPDIKTLDKKYTFTDGVGKMSDMVARLAGVQMGVKDEIPSVIQFRLGGCKGVLATDPSMQGIIDLQVRDSQFKFASDSNDLEIIRCSSFSTADLNRQLILVLSELGVENSVFLAKQEELINAIRNAMGSDDAAVKALTDRIDPNMITPVIANLIAKGKFRAINEPFVTSVLHLWRSWSLKYLKEKAKLPIPQSAFVLGCTDETQTLRGHFNDLQAAEDASYEEKEKRLPEIFLQVTDSLARKARVVQGICIVARNPSLHRGDVRVVKAVDVAALHHLRDVVVFPQNGDRDLPSMCSGGDLDGDDFVVIWDEDLLPTIWNADPFHYDPPKPVEAENVTSEQIISFFVDYMENDFLGRIAHAHLAWADAKGLESVECLELVQLHSLSVDFPKTGVPARMEKRHQRVDGYPHFMEKKSRYTSHKILGQLYDAVKKVEFKPRYKTSFDTRIINAMNPPKVLYQYVKILKGSYDDAMRQIMAQHKIKTEFEVWTTFVLDHSKKSNDYKFHEEIGRLSAALKEQYINEIAKLMGGKDLEHLAPFAVAAYRITQAEVDKALEGNVEDEESTSEKKEMPFISFPWVLHDTLTKIAAGALRPSWKAGVGQSTNEAGITLDEEGNHVFPKFTGDNFSPAGEWLRCHLPDPFQNDPVPQSPVFESDRAVEAASPLQSRHVVPIGLTDPGATGVDVLHHLDAMRVDEGDSD